MIDTHLHILPGVDDGPETLQESLTLAQVLVQEGIRCAIATPHYNDEFPRRSAMEIRERVYYLQQELDRHGIPLRLFPGHEALIKAGLLEDIQAGRLSTLNGSSYLLLELWNSTWLPETEQVIFHLRSHGIIPIIAHPERYRPIQQDPSRLAALLQQGALAQLTASSLTGMQGNTARRCAETLLKEGLIHCIASDAHGLHRRPPGVIRGLERAVELVGQVRVDQMIEAQPAAIINNQVLVKDQVPRVTPLNREGKHMRTESRQEMLPLARSYEKQRSKKKGYLLILALCLVGLILSSVGYGAYTTTYNRDIPLAQTGVQHLQKALTLLEMLQHNPLDASTLNNAQQEFTTALNSFTQVHDDVQWIPEASTSIPLVGTRLSPALHLLPLAIELSQIGVASTTGLGILASKMHNPLSAQASTQGHGFTMGDLALIHQAFQQVKTILGIMIDQINHLTPADVQIDPRVAKAVTNFRENIPALEQWVGTAEQLFTVAPALLGISTPTNYLIEILDSTELRPGGGFIGNYGIATFSGGLLTSAHVTDTYLLDRPFEAAGHSIPYPVAYSWFDLAPDWSLRDSNLDADFPTAAQYAEQNYAREGGNIPVQGVIAITPALIQHALSITGPLSIPEYHEVVTTNNLIDRIHYYQSQGTDTPSADGKSSVRKHFLAVVAEHFLARIHQLSSSDLAKFLQLAMSALHTKDIQIYFNSTVAETLLHTYHLDSSIEPPMGDGLLVVDANISPSKDNQFIVDMIHDRVTLDQQGNAHHSIIINYKWKTGIAGENSFYRDYVRIYVPPDSTFQTQNGWGPNPFLDAFGYKGDAFGYKVLAGLLLIPYGQNGSITLTWTVPGAARKDKQGWHYQYLIQRQAGAQQVLDLQVVLPSCARVTSQEGMVLSQNRQVASLTKSLSENLGARIDYTC